MNFFFPGGGPPDPPPLLDPPFQTFLVETLLVSGWIGPTCVFPHEIFHCFISIMAIIIAKDTLT